MGGYTTTITYRLVATDPGNAVGTIDVTGEVIVEVDTVDHVHDITQHIHKALTSIQSEYPAPKPVTG